MEIVAIVSALILIEYWAISFLVGVARGKTGLKAPAMQGAPEFERINRGTAKSAGAFDCLPAGDVAVRFLCAANGSWRSYRQVVAVAGGDPGDFIALPQSFASKLSICS